MQALADVDNERLAALCEIWKSSTRQRGNNRRPS
jgi:hypothetical protein